MSPPPPPAPPQPQDPLSNRALVYLASVLLLLVLTAFAPIFNNTFTTFDDDIWIGKNPALNPPSFSGLLAQWTDPFDGKTPGVFQALYSPLTHTLWYAAALAGYRGTPDGLGILLDPAPFRVLSLLGHVAATAGVYALTRQLRGRRAAGLVAAGIFALHPMQVEAVAWASGLKDVLWTALMACALACWASSLRGGPRHHATYAIALAALALLAKPTAVVIPAMLLWVWACLTWRTTPPPTAPQPRRVLTLAAILFALAVPVAILTALFQTAQLVEPVALWQRPLIAADALGHYIATLLLPVGLTIDYARSPAWTVQNWRWAGNTVLAAATFAAVVVSRDRLIWAGAGVAVLAVAPVLGLKDFDYATFTVVTDHYGYAWMVGAAVAIARAAELTATALTSRLTPVALRRVSLATAAIFAVLWASVSHLQTRVWRDSGTLYLHCLNAQPRSAIVNSNYASHLYMTAKLLPLEQRQGLVEAMRVHAARALDTWPDFPQAHYLSGMAAAILGEPRDALRHYVRAAAYYAKHADFQVKVGDIYAELGRLDDAEKHYREALRLDPDESTARRMLALIDQERARTAPPPQEPDAP